MIADEILKKHEDANEYHLHRLDRKWVMEAMDEYAKQQAWEAWKQSLKLFADDTEWTDKGQLVLFNKWWEANNK